MFHQNACHICSSFQFAVHVNWLKSWYLKHDHCHFAGAIYANFTNTTQFLVIILRLNSLCQPRPAKSQTHQNKKDIADHISTSYEESFRSRCVGRVYHTDYREKRLLIYALHTCCWYIRPHIWWYTALEDTTKVYHWIMLKLSEITFNQKLGLSINITGLVHMPRVSFKRRSVLNRFALLYGNGSD